MSESAPHGAEGTAMSMQDGDQPAFPNALGRFSDGLTKREYFAAQALPAVLRWALDEHVADDTDQQIVRDTAVVSVRAADALLAALTETDGTP